MANEVPPLETSRLLLRAMQEEDLAQIQAVFPQWEVVKYLNAKVPWPFPPDGVEVFFRETALPARARGDEWLWTIRRKIEPARIIGAISLAKTENENRGFWLDPQMRGQGYMLEACDAATDFWFEVLKFPVLRAPKAVANQDLEEFADVVVGGAGAMGIADEGDDLVFALASAGDPGSGG